MCKAEIIDVADYFKEHNPHNISNAAIENSRSILNFNTSNGVQFVNYFNTVFMPEYAQHSRRYILRSDYDDHDSNLISTAWGDFFRIYIKPRLLQG